jgi:hypothetical protein
MGNTFDINSVYFWDQLERAVTGWFSGSKNQAVRYKWIDGFRPSKTKKQGGQWLVEGATWLTEGRHQNLVPFRLHLFRVDKKYENYEIRVRDVLVSPENDYLEILADLFYPAR